MWYWDGYMGWWMLIGVIVMIVFWGGLIWLIVWGIKRATRGSGVPSDLSPLDIAKERYAKGEITREQFEEIKKNIL